MSRPTPTAVSSVRSSAGHGTPMMTCQPHRMAGRWFAYHCDGPRRRMSQGIALHPMARMTI